MNIEYKKKDNWRYLYVNGIERGWIRKVAGNSDHRRYEVMMFNKTGNKIITSTTTRLLRAAKYNVEIALSVWG